MSGKSSEYDNDFLNELIGNLLDLFFKMLFGDAEEQEVVDKMGLSDDAVKMLGAYKFKVRETFANEYDIRTGLTGVEKTEIQKERQIKYINDRIQKLKDEGYSAKGIVEFKPTEARRDLYDVTFDEPQYLQSLNEYMNATKLKMLDSIATDEKFENPINVVATSDYVDDTRMMLEGKFQSIREQYYAHFDLKRSEPNAAVDALIKETFYSTLYDEKDVGAFLRTEKAPKIDPNLPMLKGLDKDLHQELMGMIDKQQYIKTKNFTIDKEHPHFASNLNSMMKQNEDAIFTYIKTGDLQLEKEVTVGKDQLTEIAVAKRKIRAELAKEYNQINGINDGEKAEMPDVTKYIDNRIDELNKKGKLGVVGVLAYIQSGKINDDVNNDSFNKFLFNNESVMIEKMKSGEFYTYPANAPDSFKTDFIKKIDSHVEALGKEKIMEMGVSEDDFKKVGHEKIMSMGNIELMKQINNGATLTELITDQPKQAFNLEKVKSASQKFVKDEDKVEKKQYKPQQP